jgi:hypothetical protein
MDAAQTAAWWAARGEAELGQLLYWRWDPIGIRDAFPNTTSEYDSYAWPLAKLALDGADADAIAAELERLERDHMGLGRHPLSTGDEHRLEVAEAILSWHRRSLDRWQRLGEPRRSRAASSHGRIPAMSRREELDALSSKELHDRAVRRAEKHLDVRFLWNLMKMVPAAEAAAGQVDQADFDINHWSGQVADTFRDDDRELSDALRPVYLDYLEQHEDG